MVYQMNKLSNDLVSDLFYESVKEILFLYTDIKIKRYQDRLPENYNVEFLNQCRWVETLFKMNNHDYKIMMSWAPELLCEIYQKFLGEDIFVNDLQDPNWELMKEFLNMIYGAFKSKLTDLDCQLSLSIPVFCSPPDLNNDAFYLCLGQFGLTNLIKIPSC
jgi:hypothetical protein